MEENKISAKIVAHSKSSVNSKEIVTFELIYPRFIHSELMTHRLFSRNAASSRAIPVAKMLEMVRTSPAMPVRFGANQAGMQDKGVDHDASIPGWDGNGIGGKIGDWIPDCFTPKGAWTMAARTASMYAEAFSIAGYHKQVVNRLLEPFQWMKTVMTATELDNWFWLRDHADADPTIAALASKMWEVLQSSVARELEVGMWHMPYYGDGYWGCLSPDSLEDALAISSSCCAQISYRRLDDSLEKAKDIFDKLINSKPCHASPTEHQATPTDYPHCWDITELSGIDGATHIDREGNVWSGNFKNWIQHRQLIEGNACWNYKKNKEII